MQREVGIAPSAKRAAQRRVEEMAMAVMLGSKRGSGVSGTHYLNRTPLT